MCVLITRSFLFYTGLKPGQRKVLFTCFKRNDKREVKVAQLAGSVAEMSSYHHGEVRTWPSCAKCFLNERQKSPSVDLAVKMSLKQD